MLRIGTAIMLLLFIMGLTMNVTLGHSFLFKGNQLVRTPLKPVFRRPICYAELLAPANKLEQRYYKKQRRGISFSINKPSRTRA